MSIKLIATDMDGTFYRKDFSYDKELFEELVVEFEKRGIHFVVASGNQYEQLISFFDNPERFSFVSLNGSKVVDKGEIVSLTTVEKDLSDRLYDVLASLNNEGKMSTVAEDSAYMLDEASQQMFDNYKKWFTKLARIDDFHNIKTKMLLTNLFTELGEEQKTADMIAEKMNHELSCVVSGNHSVDVLSNNVNKTTGLQHLMKKWNISFDEVMTFGDSMNDLEMLKSCKYGFVMKNGSEAIKEKVGQDHIIQYTNIEGGVLKTIKEYIDNPEEFLKKF